MRETATRGALGAWLTIACVLGACAHRDAALTPPEPPLALAVVPRLGLGPRDVSVTARINRDVANREACVSFVNDEGQAVVTSCHTLDGADAPRFWQHIFEQIEAGHYTIVLQVARATGKPLQTDVDACYSGEFVSCGATGMERAQ